MRKIPASNSNKQGKGTTGENTYETQPEGIEDGLDVDYSIENSVNAANSPIDKYNLVY